MGLLRVMSSPVSLLDLNWRKQSYFLLWNVRKRALKQVCVFYYVDIYTQESVKTPFHSQILMTGVGDGRQRLIFYTQKYHNFRILQPKKNHYFFKPTPKNSLVLFSQPQKIPLFFLATQKNPSVFPRPPKITFGQNLRPQNITRTPRH